MYFHRWINKCTLYCLEFPFQTVFTNSGPEKSTPVLAKGCRSLNLNSGISDDGSTLYDLLSCLLRTTQLKFCFLMTCRPLVSQKRDLNSVSVSLTPLCITLWWQSLIMSLVIWWSRGNHAGNLAVSGRDELQSLPLHLKIHFMSLITPSWKQCCLKFRFSGRDFKDSNMHTDSLNNTSSLMRLTEPTGLGLRTMP